MEEPRANCYVPFVNEHLERDALADPCDLLRFATELVDQTGIRARLRPDLDCPVGKTDRARLDGAPVPFLASLAIIG